MGLFDMIRVCPNCKKAVKTGITGRCPVCKTGTILHDDPGNMSLNRTVAQWNGMNEQEKQEFVDNALQYKGIANKEYRVLCETCGHIYCYTQADLEENLKHAKKAVGASLMSFGNAMAGTQYGMHANDEKRDREIDKIIDYEKCPKCNSRSIRQLSEEEYKKEVAAKNNNVNNTTVSAANELKKFKELLDSGIITQEEFDAKKKQLLGL